MESPFTLKRYMMTALTLCVLGSIPVCVYMFRHGFIWSALLLVFIFGLAIPFNFWIVGEIGWRGVRSTQLAPVSIRSILIRLASGTGLIVLSPHIPPILWELSEDLVSSTLELTGSIMGIFAVGQVIGLGMMKSEQILEFVHSRVGGRRRDSSVRHTKFLFYLSAFLLFWLVIFCVNTKSWSGWLLCVSCLILSLMFGHRWYKDRQFRISLTKLRNSQESIKDSSRVDTKRVDDSSKE